MSVRLYVGNLPQNLKIKELEELFASIGKGIRFKAVLDRDTKACRGFGFANINKEKIADEVIEKTKVKVSNNLLNFLIYPPFKRFL